MKLFYCSDLHGDEKHYVRLLESVKAAGPDLVVLGGDLLPDDSANKPESLGQGQPRFVRQRFRKAITELHNAAGCQTVLVIFGNHDWASSVAAMHELAREGLVTILDHKRVHVVDGVGFLGYSFSPPTPWYVKDFERLDEPDDRPPLLGGARWDPRFSRASGHGAGIIFGGDDSIANDLAELDVPTGPWVFVAHAPPFETDLDRNYQRKPFGSRAVRAAIERYQPLLSLHGHIHESPKVSGSFKQRIGKTLAVNPGQTGDKLQYSVIEIDVATREVVRVEHRQQE